MIRHSWRENFTLRVPKELPSSLRHPILDFWGRNHDILVLCGRNWLFFFLDMYIFFMLYRSGRWILRISVSRKRQKWEDDSLWRRDSSNNLSGRREPSMSSHLVCIIVYFRLLISSVLKIMDALVCSIQCSRVKLGGLLWFEGTSCGGERSRLSPTT